ncbi:MAG: uracil-DNA glycosylase [Alphaproteobacteria bacterium]|nr:uracil-DNA glycosylase [Alphaproteobacteria bacterium]
MDALAALRLQIEWGADEALDDAPVDRFAAPAPRPRAVEVAPPAETPRPVMAPTAAAPAALPMPAQRASDIAANCRTLEDLRAALAVFDGCPLATTATNLVFGDGNPASGLMLVGEGPGAEEDRAGRPFVGPSGQLLDRMLASIGLDRTRCYITNLIPWRPPGNRNPTDSEIVVCLPFLLRHIALVRPKHLVLLGNMSVQSVVGTKSGITRMRGRWLDLALPGLDAPVRCLPMLHPAYLLRTHGAKRDAWADMIALRRALDQG